MTLNERQHILLMMAVGFATVVLCVAILAWMAAMTPA